MPVLFLYLSDWVNTSIRKQHRGKCVLKSHICLLAFPLKAQTKAWPRYAVKHVSPHSATLPSYSALHPLPKISPRPCSRYVTFCVFTIANVCLRIKRFALLAKSTRLWKWKIPRQISTSLLIKFHFWHNSLPWGQITKEHELIKIIK